MNEIKKIDNIVSDLSFEYFYNKAKNKADEALRAAYDRKFNYDELSKKAVDYMYKNLSETEKNIFKQVAFLDEEKKKILGTENYTIKFSVESLTKNIIRHPDVSLKEYFLIPEIIDKTEILIYIPENSIGYGRILCFSKFEQYYKATIKTTGQKNENYLVSFHSIDINGIKRDKKKKGAKIIYEKPK